MAAASVLFEGEVRMRQTLVMPVAAALCFAAACTNSTGPSASLNVIIVPSSVTASKDQNLFLTATVKDAGGTTIAPDSVRWSSADATKATVSAAGLLRTLAATPGVYVGATAFEGSAQGSAQILVIVTAFSSGDRERSASVRSRAASEVP